MKVIVNARNFGHLRSPHYAMMHAEGDAVGMLLSDLQDPPELMGDMIAEWAGGTPVVVAIKNTSEESWLMYRIRSLYYGTIGRLPACDYLNTSPALAFTTARSWIFSARTFATPIHTFVA